MATVVKKDINQAIRNFEIEITASINNNKFTIPEDLNPVIYVTQLSPRKYRVGWHFEKNTAVEGDVINYDDGTVAGSEATVVLVITYRG